MTLDAWLTARGMSEARFGEKIGRSQPCVNRYRKGERMPDPVTMRKISKATRWAVTANDFYGWVLKRRAA